jgi:predicted dinucleotide-binding enzyme
MSADLDSLPMKIAIIGAGSLGRALGTRLAQRGHAIMFGGTASAQEAAAEQAAAASLSRSARSTVR